MATMDSARAYNTTACDTQQGRGKRTACACISFVQQQRGRRR